MNRSLIELACAAALLAAGLLFVSRQRALTGFRAGNAALRQQLQQQTSLAPAELPGGLPATALVSELSPEEHRELLCLRGQVQPLRSEIEALSNRLAAAKERAPVASRSFSPTAVQLASMQRERGLIAAVVKERYGGPSLTGTKADLPALQRLLDDQVFSKDQTNELVCLGIAFGDILASELGLRWANVAGARGANPQLRFKDAPLQVFPLNLIPRLVARDETVDLAALFQGVSDSVARMEKESGPTHAR